MQTTGKMIHTKADYDLLPPESPYQLIEGKLVMTPAPFTKHQRASRNLELELFVWLRKNKIGEVFDAPTDVELDDKNIVQPDLVVIKRDHYDMIGEKRIVGAPDLIVEILSPDNAYNDLKRKFRLYERCGVMEYWIVDPEFETVDIYLNEGGRYVLREQKEKNGVMSSVALEGFQVEISDIFADLLR